ncbi:MAG: hypothetical protein QOD41_2761 [Cryptosporangiaceae bacterium]|nr:hypothetical protein [Cryptosporangiaceae bacterium]
MEFGKGDPLVVFRTVLPDSANPTGLTRWAELRFLKPLAARFRMLIIGRRPGLQPGLTMADLAPHHAEEIRQLFDRPVSVMGISTAGSLALQFAADHPTLVGRLVIGAAGARLGPQGRTMQRCYADLLAAGRHRSAARALAPSIVDSSLGQMLVAAVMAAIATRPADPDGMVTMLLAEDAFDISGRLTEITAPTLVIAGTKDNLYPPDLAQRIANGVQDGRLRLYEGRRHHTVMTDHRFHHDVISFLTSE